MEQELRIFIQDFEKELCPLTKSCNLAYWNAAISGKEEEYKKAEELQLKLVKFFADKEKFLQLKKIKEAGVIQDSLLQRKLTILYNQFMLSLEDTAKLNEIVRAEVAIEQKYSTFRAEIKGKKYSDNDIDKILKESTDEATLKEAWTCLLYTSRCV